MTLPLSILDLATVGRGESVADSLANSVALARRAEELGYGRVWYAEHHNIPGIASSATSVLIAHVAAHTSTIRLGSGGVMLPNHAPLIIAEQFGMLESLHPGRIDLGLGRAPGTDQNTVRALRRDPRASETFPQDVQELQGYLGEETLVPGVNAIPGQGTGVPLYILGSSLFGAKVAAALGLPYAFASHFAPDALEQAVAAYRAEFRPSGQLGAPHVIAGVNAIAADDDAVAQREFQIVKRARLKMLVTGRRRFTDEEADAVLETPQAAPVHQMVKHTAVGTAETVGEYLDRFAKQADADELMVAHQSSTLEGRLRSAELVAEVAL
ncbi:luciferase family oxidoreductase, group 1 [Pseudonocardia ammonioxydans]|uniref:Luciferase family oxidoreductase, group 1 n=1 Tax=Pseudonocardia ammonioxydans TaxID=260086 RepID=A0A1I5E8K1_PSUAM|nr:LLM class flavin-dependent oxidoreductase [Pseudonocardia ammonioxydans]SFO07680.1 luciferase family oxidoreductase, group 1 [Pseudonocardia ammonioxydans]